MWFDTLITFFQKKKKVDFSPKRNFFPPYLIQENAQQFFEKYGYVVFSNILDDKIIKIAQDEFEKIQQLEGYVVNNKFESSGNFSSISTQEYIFKFVKNYLTQIAPLFANLSNCEIGDGGAFFIKPNTAESILHPHQDSTVIDETQFYGTFIWIPLQDAQIENGPLYVLPKSHRWGNSYRSQHIKWAFRNHSKFLWSQMKPILAKKGDIICFDTSIIHASGINKSNKDRVVVCGALLPKNHQKIEYLSENNCIFEYKIDSSYWLDGGKKESLKQYNFEIKNHNFPNPVSKKYILNLINKTDDK